jgi:hypothetical protein
LLSWKEYVTLSHQTVWSTAQVTGYTNKIKTAKIIQVLVDADYNFFVVKITEKKHSKESEKWNALKYENYEVFVYASHTQRDKKTW